MMKFYLKLLVAILGVCGLIACQQQDSSKNKTAETKIGIILPLEHHALQEIVAGFSDKLREIYPKPVQIKVMNAQGDANLQRAIIQQMRDQNYNLIVPVATGVTQMTVSMIHDKPIISLASQLSENDRRQLHPCNITAVHDEIPSRALLEFIHTANPNLKHLALIHSTSDKILPEVKQAIADGKQLGIEIQPFMVATLPDLISTSQVLPEDTQGIFILKDNLIASGIATLANMARAKHILLFTSDEGTVEGGAGLALGVHERQIGEEGATLAALVLSNHSVCSLPIVKMKKLNVFINKDAIKQEMQDLAQIEAAAKKLQYPVEYIARK